MNDEKVIAFEIEKQAQLRFEGINSYLGVTIKPVNPAPNIEESEKDMLTETGRNAIRELTKALSVKQLIQMLKSLSIRISNY
ncbi:hypothetical protein [Solibacillus merdavium]|uniref:hypothetical protein n=1 Tax=Solibacillus merdavium TaxID=2762218 RepID=UPI00178735D3|nr:hypothetical protein [Solibacillus merdavium]